MNNKRILFVKICFYIGVVIDALATIPLLFPEIAKLMFGINNIAVGDEYLYASRIAASLMFGWTLLLLWGSFKPVERKGVLLLTLIPVIFGLFISSILTVLSGFIALKYVLPLWIFYILIIPLYIVGYIYASKAKRES